MSDLNSQYNTNSTLWGILENEQQYYEPSISDNSQSFYFEEDNETLPIDQINENQKRSNPYMHSGGFDDHERAVKMAKLDESELSTYGESELLNYRDPNLSSCSESDLSLYGDPGLSSYGDQGLFTYGGQSFLSSYEEPELSSFDYLLAPFIDSTSLYKQDDIDGQLLLQDIRPYIIDGQLSSQEIDEQLPLQEIKPCNIVEQPSLQMVEQYEINKQPSLQVAKQYVAEEQATTQYEVEEQPHLQEINQYEAKEHASLQDIKPLQVEDHPSLNVIKQYDISDHSPLQEVKRFELNDKSPLQEITQYNVNDQLSLQDTKQYDINDHFSSQRAKQHEIDEQSSLQDIKPYVIEEKPSLQDIKPYSLQNLKYEVVEQSLQDIKPNNSLISSLNLSQHSLFSPNRNPLFSTVNNPIFPAVNAIQNPNNILSQNNNSPLPSNVNNLLFNFNNSPLPNEIKPNIFENRPGTYSKSINLQDLLEMIPLDESNKTPVSEAMRKINARKGIVPGLSIQLMDHQVIGVSWMVDQEIKDKVRGGILADDMGLGKTIQTIATIVINRPDTKKSKSSKSTLIVAPTALIYQWKSEILSKTDQGLFEVHVYHGQNKASYHNLKKYDIVITTYQTLLRECPESDDGDKGSLFRMNWYRVVLDEAQNIKNRNSRASKACALLSSTYRWCLTGTPIQNHIDDLYPYFRFLDISNFSDWQTFHEQFSSASQRAIQRAQTVLRGFLLRRTKDSKLDGKPLLVLPEKTVSFVKQEFSRDEREFYDALEKRSRIAFNRYLKEGSVLKNYAYILVMLLRLRQACNHPFLTQEDIGHVITSADDSRMSHSSSSNSNFRDKDIPSQLERAKKLFSDKVITRLFEKYKDNSANDDCPICYDIIDNGIVTTCGHVFCLDCIKNAIDSENKENVIDVEDRKCPFCRSPIKERDFINLEVFIPPVKNELHDDDDDIELPTLDEVISSSFSGSDDISLSSKKEDSEKNIDLPNISGTNNTFANAPEGLFLSSTKIDQLMKELALAQQEDPGCKTIVFSQWTSMLDLVEKPIKDVGYKFCRYDGTMDVKERDNSLQKLIQDAEVTIMLVSLKAAVEDQAIDRVHRIGQFKNVIIKRLTIKDTIEDRILILQDKKRELAAGALGEGSIKVGRLTVEDLIFLFR
ncbi:11603_t:CDS:10 [Dentiscutata heterogama]|uniref:11603_t:CDS:1 n=1 Tax=Dentiscutata heterogama TaxID=1316150 RepID=A0ACA9KFF2_9GLOM|nr:11603_t:CDS:10 [Dentiscutata heterogama]